MNEDVEYGEWSVVMTGSRVKPGDKAAWRWREKGFDAVLFHEAEAVRHLPAEVYSGLTYDKAAEVAAGLSEVAVVELVHTDEVSDVRHRAPEVWYSRCTGTHCFFEIEGLITRLCPVNGPDRVRRVKERHADWAQWQIEQLVNFMDLPPIMCVRSAQDEAITEAEGYVARLARALKDAYPDIAFTISHVPGLILSFWQTTEDSPRGAWLPFGKEPEVPTGKGVLKGQCPVCGQERQFARIEYDDPRVPGVAWAACSACGERMIVRPHEWLTFVEPTPGENG